LAYVNFTLYGYEYYFTQSNYGLSFTSNYLYKPIVVPGNLAAPTQIRMGKFNTKIYSDTYAPFRIAFKLSPTPFLVNNLVYNSNYRLQLINLDMLAPYTNF
jgi:hypothetical protein